MQNLIIKIFKILEMLHFKIAACFQYIYCNFLFYINGVNIESFKTNGILYLHKSFNATIVIGNNFKMNNGVKYSNSGLNGKCRIEVRDKASLSIGNNVGMSDVTISCHKQITIGNNVLLGVGSQLRDTDNHSLNPMDRINGLDWENKKTSPILIEDNVFIGMNSIILKGVVIGKNSIVGAGSVVTKSILKNEIWGGNPARFIKKIS